MNAATNMEKQTLLGTGTVIKISPTFFHLETANRELVYFNLRDYVHPSEIEGTALCVGDEVYFQAKLGQSGHACKWTGTLFHKTADLDISASPTGCFSEHLGSANMKELVKAEANDLSAAIYASAPKPFAEEPYVLGAVPKAWGDQSFEDDASQCTTEDPNPYLNRPSGRSKEDDIVAFTHSFPTAYKSDIGNFAYEQLFEERVDSLADGAAVDMEDKGGWTELKHKSRKGKKTNPVDDPLSKRRTAREGTVTRASSLPPASPQHPKGLPTVREQSIDRIVNALTKRGPLPLKNLMGYIATAGDAVKAHVGTKETDILSFIQKSPKVFRVTNPNNVIELVQGIAKLNANTSQSPAVEVPGMLRVHGRVVYRLVEILMEQGPLSIGKLREFIAEAEVAFRDVVGTTEEDILTFIRQYPRWFHFSNDLVHVHSLQESHTSLMKCEDLTLDLESVKCEASTSSSNHQHDNATVEYIANVLRNTGPLSATKLAGHLGQASSHVREQAGRNHEGLAVFCRRHPQTFHVTSDGDIDVKFSDPVTDVDKVNDEEAGREINHANREAYAAATTDRPTLDTFPKVYPSYAAAVSDSASQAHCKMSTEYGRLFERQACDETVGTLESGTITSEKDVIYNRNGMKEATLPTYATDDQYSMHEDAAVVGYGRYCTDPIDPLTKDMSADCHALPVNNSPFRDDLVVPTSVPDSVVDIAHRDPSWSDDSLDETFEVYTFQGFVIHLERECRFLVGVDSKLVKLLDIMFCSVGCLNKTFERGMLLLATFDKAALEVDKAEGCIHNLEIIQTSSVFGGQESLCLQTTGNLAAVLSVIPEGSIIVVQLLSGCQAYLDFSLIRTTMFGGCTNPKHHILQGDVVCFSVKCVSLAAEKKCAVITLSKMEVMCKAVLENPDFNCVSRSISMTGEGSENTNAACSDSQIINGRGLVCIMLYPLLCVQTSSGEVAALLDDQSPPNVSGFALGDVVVFDAIQSHDGVAAWRVVRIRSENGLSWVDGSQSSRSSAMLDVVD